MQSKTCLKAIVFLVVLSNAWPSAAMELEDIRIFTNAERSALKTRYEAFRTNPELFSDEEFQAIEEKRLAPLIDALILHPQIKLDEPQALIDFAQQIADSAIEFRVLEPRIKTYLKKDMPLFDALTRAIERETFHQWKQRQIQRVKSQNGQFVKSIQSLGLSNDDANKVINVYSVCVAPYLEPSERTAIKPKVCEATDVYKKPRHNSHKASVRTSPSSDENARVHAYRTFIEEIQKVAYWQSLDAFEKINLSKCVAEQSLQFLDPSDHPLKALSKLVKMHTKSPEEAFFMRSGVCGNFSGIAYNIARELGFEDKVFLAQKGVHIYVEFEKDNDWYHSHPFNSQGPCDITKF